MATIADILDTATRTLASCSDSPRLDAEILLGFILELPRSALIVRSTDAVPEEGRNRYDELLARRTQGAPIAYLTGLREFWSLPLTVTPAVLVPRPETELLVELTLQTLPRNEEVCVLDLGTGSGAIALAIASERPRACITGVDVSPQALTVARGNAAALGFTRIEWLEGSWFAAVPHRRFRLIVANPPYIASDDPALQKLAAEPLLALAPGPTGLEAFVDIIDHAAAYLEPGGRLILEHGYTQGTAVARLLESRGFGGIESHADLAGNPRVTLATFLLHH